MGWLMGVLEGWNCEFNFTGVFFFIVVSVQCHQLHISLQSCDSLTLSLFVAFFKFHELSCLVCIKNERATYSKAVTE
jgi:hypothetical protein